MESDRGDLLLQTLDLLEWRLQTVEFVLNGGVAPSDPNKDSTTVLQRLAKAEEAVRGLSSKSRPVAEALKLQTRHPELFSSRPIPSSTFDDKEEMGPAETLSVVLSEAPSYPATASQLTSLRDLPVPPTSSFASLIGLESRMAEVSALQAGQAAEISALRKRTARLLLQWYEVSILGQGRCWAEWDTRLREVERSIRRGEVAKEKYEGEA